MSCLIKKEEMAVRRQTNFGQYDDDGFASTPKNEDKSFKGSAQPLSGNEILQVPEGDRTRKILNVFTDFELQHKDIVIRKGEEFEVQVVEDWTMPGECIAYFKARVVKVDVGR